VSQPAGSDSHPVPDRGARRLCPPTQMGEGHPGSGRGVGGPCDLSWGGGHHPL